VSHVPRSQSILGAKNPQRLATRQRPRPPRLPGDHKSNFGNGFRRIPVSHTGAYFCSLRCLKRVSNEIRPAVARISKARTQTSQVGRRRCRRFGTARHSSRDPLAIGTQGTRKLPIERISTKITIPRPHLDKSAGFGPAAIVFARRAVVKELTAIRSARRGRGDSESRKNSEDKHSHRALRFALLFLLRLVRKDGYGQLAAVGGRGGTRTMAGGYEAERPKPQRRTRVNTIPPIAAMVASIIEVGSGMATSTIRI